MCRSCCMHFMIEDDTTNLLRLVNHILQQCMANSSVFA